MTEKEILDLQEKSGQQQFYMMLVGKFFLAYGHGAFALSRGTGYRVMRKVRKAGDVTTCGFPIERLDTVLQRVRDAGGVIEAVEPQLYRFGGLDGTPDERMVQASEKAPRSAVHDCRAASAPVRTADTSWLSAAVLGFNLSMSTPLDAMNFIGKLQQQLKDGACESPSGHGLTE